MPFVHPHFASRPPPVRKTKDLSSVKRVNKTRTERLVPRDDDKLPEEEVYSCCMNHTFSKCPDLTLFVNDFKTTWVSIQIYHN